MQKQVRLAVSNSEGGFMLKSFQWDCVNTPMANVELLAWSKAREEKRRAGWGWGGEHWWGGSELKPHINQCFFQILPKEIVKIQRIQ